MNLKRDSIWLKERLVKSFLQWKGSEVMTYIERVIKNIIQLRKIYFLSLRRSIKRSWNKNCMSKIMKLEEQCWTLEVDTFIGQPTLEK